MRQILPLLFLCSFSSALFAQSADLSVAIKPGLPTIVPYSTELNTGVTYTITNAGPDTAKDVAFTTNLHYTYLTLPPAFANCSSSTNGTTCTASSLAPGTYQIQFTIYTFVTASGPYPISASVASSTADSNLSNNSGSSSIAIVFQSDLEMWSARPDAFAKAGGPLKLDVNWFTNGPSAAEDLTVVVDVPAGFKPNGLVQTDFPNNGKCQFPADFNGGQIVCHFGTQDYGGDITFFGTTAGNLAPGTRLQFKSTVSSPADTTAGNDTATGSSVIVAPTDLKVTLQAGPREFGWMGARVTVQNTSAVEAEVPLLEIAFNGTFAYDKKAPAGWTCGLYTLNIPGLHTGCRGATLAPGATATFEFVSYPDHSGSIKAEVVATSVNDDLTPADNRVSETATAGGLTNWAVQTSAPATAPFGVDVTVNVFAKNLNAGPSPAQVTYTVPASADLVSYPGGICQLKAGTSPVVIECGADKDATFPIVIHPKTPGSYLHQASVNVWSDIPDPDLSNNATVSKTEVADPWAANLAVTLDASPTAPILGQPVTYTVTVKNGGGELATPVSFIDTLPASLALTTVPDGCTSANATLTCTWPSLAAAEVRTLSFTATPLTPGEIVDTVSLGDKTATATIEVSTPRRRSVHH